MREQPRLTMRHFTDAFLDDYIPAEEPTFSDRSALPARGRGTAFDRIEGDYSRSPAALLELLGFPNKGMILS
jgi:hypothetical protein